MNRTTIHRFLLCSTLLGFCLPATAWAGPATDTVKTMQKAAEKDDIDALDRHVAFDQIARASLAKHWSSFEDEERNVFLESFRTLVRRAYQKGLSGKKKQELEFVSEAAEADGIVVKTLVEVRPKEPKLSVNYLMSCEGSKCRLVDVVTDGASLVRSWKRSFNRIIKRHGKGELIARIEKKAKAGSE